MKHTNLLRHMSLMLVLALMLTVSVGAMDGMPPGGFGGDGAPPPPPPGSCKRNSISERVWYGVV